MIAIVYGGKKFNPYVAVEGRLGLSISDDEIDYTGFDNPPTTNAEITQLLGVYFRFSVPDTVYNPYFLLGYNNYEGEFNASDFQLQGDVTNFSYGFGLGYKTTKGDQIGLEYMDYRNDGAVSIVGIGINFTRSF